MPQTRAALLKHQHHLMTLANGAKHERDYVLKTAPASFNTLLHSIAMDVVNGKLSIPPTHRTKPKIDGIVRFAGANVDQRKRMLRGRNQHGAGWIGALGAIGNFVRKKMLGALHISSMDSAMDGAGILRSASFLRTIF